MRRAWVRWALLALAVLAVPVIGFVGVMASTFMGNGAIVDGKMLPDGGVIVQDGYVSLALLPAPGLDRGFVLVDAGNDPAGVAIDRALTERGAVRDDVAAILVTHGHPDHTAACGGFPNAKVYALQAEAPLMRGEVAARGPLPRMFGAAASSCAPDQMVWVADGEHVRIGDLDVRPFAVPGHTAGSAAWYVDGVVFFGDAADASAEGELTVAKWVFTDDQALATRSLTALSRRLTKDALPVSMLVFSHTGTLDGIAPLTAFAAAHP